MAMTIEALEQKYKGREYDLDYFNLQSVLGSKADAAAAYDKDGKFHCIKWFDCRFCPAFNPEHCI